MMDRHDDGQRGPAVQDAIPLSDCYRLLISLDVTSHPLRKIADREYEKMLSPRYSAAQLASAVMQLSKEAVAKSILKEAIQSGVLQLWVRPIGEGETPVAKNAILEFTHDTFATGVYIPMNDKGWLYGKLLFVKTSQWATFIIDLSRRQKPAISNRPSKIEADCKNWLRQQFVDGVAGSRDEFFTRAQTEFPGLSQRGFKVRIWPPIAEEFQRNKPGRPKKN
jgi:hypothetical protein